MMDPNAVAPMLITLGMCAAAVIIVSFVLRHKRQIRELLSRERIAALEKGVEIPWEMDLSRPNRTRRLHLKSGVLLIGLGLGLALVSLVVQSSDRRDVLVWAILLLVMGATNVLYDHLVGKAEWERTIAMDEALTRAYIRRLEGGEARRDDASTESPRHDR